MLSEEEKKVINSLENEYKKLEEKGNILFPLYKQQTKILLNIITKPQKENEKLNLMIAKSTAQRVLTDIKHSKKSNEDLEMLAKGYDIEIQKLQKENEEKDKQIDLMAGEIEYAGCIKKVWKCDEKNCKDCIKQYFEKLAKESRG